MRLPICQRGRKESVYAGKHLVYILKSYLFFIGMDIYVHILCIHANIQYINGIAPLHQHSAVRLACGNRDGVIAHYPAVDDGGLIISVMLAESGYADITADTHTVEVLFVVNQIIAYLLAVYGIYGVVQSARGGEYLFIVRRISKSNIRL